MRNQKSYLGCFGKQKNLRATMMWACWVEERNSSHRSVYDHAVTSHCGTRICLQTIQFISYEKFSIHAQGHFWRSSSNYIKSFEDSLFIDSLMEAGSNTPTVTVPIVGVTERAPSAWRYIWATLFLGDIYTVTLLSCESWTWEWSAGEDLQQL